MIHIDARSRVPIYEQICESVAALILNGLLEKDEQLPSVRALATELAINPNTISRAYHSLEQDGLIYSLPGRGSFIALSAEDLSLRRQPEVFRSLDKVLADLAQLNLSEADIIHHVQLFFATRKGGATHDSTIQRQ